jgi:sulfate transport system permease protein
MNQTKKNAGAWILILIVVVYMGFLILAPIIALIRGAFQDGFKAVWESVTSPVLGEALLLSLKIAVLVVLVQAVFGSLVAWVLVRHRFPGRALFNSLIDIPFALSPVVVGYVILLLFGRNGLLYPVVETLDFQVAFAVPGMFLATLFVSLPFMVREMVPVITNLDRAQEYAAATLGANQWTVFWRIIFPQLKSAVIYGISLTLARALGEFGAVLVVGGGVQGRTETTTLYIFRCIDERHNIEAYTASILLGAFSVLIVSFADMMKRAQKKKQTANSTELRV